MKTTGGCFCGAIRYEAEFEEKLVGICHCRDCQMFSGSAFRLSGPMDPSRFRITKGTPKHFDKTADSGKVRRMLFCGECGSHLCSQPADPNETGAYISLRVATCDDFAKLRPAVQIYCRSRVSWFPAIDGTAEIPEMP